MSIRAAKGLRFASADIAAKELVFKGSLGSSKYVFDTAACERDFQIHHGVLYEFYFDMAAKTASAEKDVAAAVGSPLGSPFIDSATAINFNASFGTKNSSQAFLGRYFIILGTMKTPLDTGDEKTSSAGSGAAASGKDDSTSHAKEPPPLYIFDAEELTLFCLAEATSAATLKERYPLRPVAEEAARRFFEMRLPDCPYGFSTGLLQEKYLVRSGEEVYLSVLGEIAVVIGECFGCIWVRLGQSRRLTALGKATSEARLVTLYGLSDVSNAPPPGQQPRPGQQQVVTPRSVQTPRAAGAGGPPFTLNKRTADGKPAVLCNCALNQTVLAVCSEEALKVFGVRPMTRIFFTLGVDAGKSATILGVRNGSLYVHIDGEMKCTCLRNASNAAEVRERYTGSGGGSVDGTSPPTASAATMPKSASLKDVGSGGSSLPVTIPKLSLSGIGSQISNVFSGSFATTTSSPPAARDQTPRPSDSRSNPQPPSPTAGNSSSASTAAVASPAGRGFYFWTAHGCMQFDVSIDGCKSYSLRHGQTVRFSAGVDAGNIFHVVGVRGGNMWVVPDRGDFAIPLRHCANADDVRERVGPVLVGTTRLRSADPRGVPPMSTALRSPDRRAGSPFGISPRNTSAQDEEGNAIDFGKQQPRLGASHNNNNSASRSHASREINFGDAGSSASFDVSSGKSRGSFGNSNQLSSRDLSPSPPKLQINKSVSPGSRSESNGSMTSAVFGARVESYNDVSVGSRGSASLSNVNLRSQANFGTASAEFVPRELQGRGSSASQHQQMLATDLTEKPAIQIHVPAAVHRSTSGGADGGAGIASSQFGSSSAASEPLMTALHRNAARIAPPPAITTDAFKASAMPSTRIFLKAIALRALGIKREADMPTAFFRFYSHDAGSNLTRALQEMPRFVDFWDQREKPLRGGRSFGEATTDMMVEALENLAQLEGRN